MIYSRKRFSDYGFMRGNRFIFDEEDEGVQTGLRQKFSLISQDPGLAETKNIRSSRKLLLPALQTVRKASKQTAREPNLEFLEFKRIRSQSKKLATLLEDLVSMNEGVPEAHHQKGDESRRSRRIIEGDGSKAMEQVEEERQSELLDQQQQRLKETIRQVALNKHKRLLQATHEMSKLFSGQPIVRPRRRVLLKY